MNVVNSIFIVYDWFQYMSVLVFVFLLERERERNAKWFSQLDLNIYFFLFSVNGLLCLARSDNRTVKFPFFKKKMPEYRECLIRCVCVCLCVYYIAKKPYRLSRVLIYIALDLFASMNYEIVIIHCLIYIQHSRHWRCRHHRHRHCQ